MKLLKKNQDLGPVSTLRRIMLKKMEGSLSKRETREDTTHQLLLDIPIICRLGFHVILDHCDQLVSPKLPDSDKGLKRILTRPQMLLHSCLFDCLCFPVLADVQQAP